MPMCRGPCLALPVQPTDAHPPHAPPPLPPQARFTEAILRQMAGIAFPPNRIFSQTVSGRPKSEVLARLQVGGGGGVSAWLGGVACRPTHPRAQAPPSLPHPPTHPPLPQAQHPDAASLHFVEDKLSTLEKARGGGGGVREGRGRECVRARAWVSGGANLGGQQRGCASGGGRSPPPLPLHRPVLPALPLPCTNAPRWPPSPTWPPGASTSWTGGTTHQRSGHARQPTHA